MQIVLTIPSALEVAFSATASVVGFVIGKVVFRYMFLPWLGHYLAAKLGSSLRPSVREAIISRHYAYRKRGKIHQSKWPWLCNDGKCSLL